MTDLFFSFYLSTGVTTQWPIASSAGPLLGDGCRFVLETPPRPRWSQTCVNPTEKTAFREMSNGDGIIKSSCIPVLLYVITSYYIFIFDS